MKVRSIVSLLAILAILFQSHGAYAQMGGVQKSGPKPLTFDNAKFIATVNKNKLGAGILDGYAAVLIKDGNLVV